MSSFKMSGFALIALMTLAFSAPISTQIAYQGVLVDGAGNSFRDSTYSLTFSLFTDSTGGTPKWSETKQLITKNGMFSHMLGSVASLDTVTFDMQYWLSVTIGIDENGPRIKLAVASYAMRALVADSAGKVDGNSILQNSIDSTKIANGAITTNEILDGTIQSEDVSSTFVSPKATIADIASDISSSVITTDHVINVDGSKITPNFGSQNIETTGKVIAQRFESNSGSFPVQIVSSDSMSFT